MKSLPSGWKYSIGLIVSILLLFAANLWVGSVRIPAVSYTHLTLPTN